MTSLTGQARILNLRNILILAFLLRLIVPLTASIVTQDHRVYHSPDTASYVEAAQSLLDRADFSNAQSVEIRRTPGYPLFLVPGLWLNHLETFTIFLQIILGCFTIYLIWIIAHLLFESEIAASIAALVYAVEPLSIVYTGKILTETLFTVVILTFAFLFIKYIRTQRKFYLIFPAIVLACSVYIRPISYYLPIIFTLMILGWGWSRNNNLKATVKHAGIFLIISVVLIGAWQVRNKMMSGYS